MSRKVLIICCGGMSSSMIARKATRYFSSQDLDIEVEACDVANSHRMLHLQEHDLYLISPQIRMVMDTIAKTAEDLGLHIANIPGPLYVPVGKGFNDLADFIVENLDSVPETLAC
ncbi:PTS cellobiose transporter subunit IIB [Erysipelotrichaceae bacterium RD49]|nr:PTS cellobiose transporter subunit IIB [Erysipelotrichaceae bacterium RD49]